MAKIEDIKKKEEVYTYLRDMILNLDIVPGDKVPEQDIAKHFGISRTPVREAVRRLAGDGLVKLDPNRSATVTVVDDEMIRDLALVRMKQDELAIPLAIYNGSPRDFAQLRSLAQSCIEANEKGDIRRRHRLDAAFHLKLVEIGRSKTLYQIQEQLSYIIQLWQNICISDKSVHSKRLEDHFDIIDCLERRDQSGALKILRDHIAASYGIGEELIRDLQIQYVSDLI